MDVRAVLVVVGQTESMDPPDMDVNVGATDARSASWFQPSPSTTSKTT
jgi:hypothetical protein